MRQRPPEQAPEQALDAGPEEGPEVGRAQSGRPDAVEERAQPGRPEAVEERARERVQGRAEGAPRREWGHWVRLAC